MARFSVYHATKTGAAGRLSFGLDAHLFPDDFSCVALVVTDDINRVFELTNHITCPWPDNLGVAAAPGPHRSTSVGDVVVAEDGIYVVAPIGLRKVCTLDAAPTTVQIPAVY